MIEEIENQIIALLKGCEFDAAQKQLGSYKIDDFNSAEYASIHTLKSLLAFLEGDMTAINNYPNKCIEIFHERYGKGREFFRHGNMVSIFYIYLSKLAKWAENNPEYYAGVADKKLYLIGDSHCLSSANQIIDNKKLIPKLLFNAKAYNLKNTAFSKLISSCEQGSSAMFIFGEIDCRINEGIYPRYENSSQDELRNAIDKLVNDYVDYILAEARDKFAEISFANIPAPQAGLCKAQGYDVSQHKDYPLVTKLFNEALNNKLNSNNIIDLYAQTVGKDGWGNRDNMLDQVHLLPNIISDLIKKPR